jgi:hypothetical protein
MSAGQVYAENCAKALKKVSKSVNILKVPEGKPPKWDAADAVLEGFDVKGFLDAECVCAPSINKRNRINWMESAYEGEAPERRWLVNQTFPLGSVSLLVAMGDTGKGMLTLDLGLKVACDYEPDLLNPYPVAFGNDVVECGEVSIYTAEDSRDEVHRRLNRLDPSDSRFGKGNRLAVIPLPNAGGPFALVRPSSKGPETTDEFEELREELLGTPNLKMVVLDPLSSFVPGDLDKDNALGAYVTGKLASLAEETGAAIIICHHMRKDVANKPIASLAQARAGIRGTTSLVNGVRMAYCLWPTSPETARQTCEMLGVEWAENKVFHGGVVKANGPADREIKVFVRQESGLLADMNECLRQIKPTSEQLKSLLIEAIAQMAIAGRPFQATGQSGVYERREDLPPTIRDLGRDKLHKLVRGLLNEGKIGKAAAPGEKSKKWLDVEGGPFQQGEGTFEPGFDPRGKDEE